MCHYPFCTTKKIHSFQGTTGSAPLEIGWCVAGERRAETAPERATEPRQNPPGPWRLKPLTTHISFESTLRAWRLASARAPCVQGPRPEKLPSARKRPPARSGRGGRHAGRALVPGEAGVTPSALSESLHLRVGRAPGRYVVVHAPTHGEVYRARGE